MKKILLTLQLIALPLFSYAQTKTVSFTATGTTNFTTTFTVPAGVTPITINAWGGGGGGGSAIVGGLDLQRGGGGGGGGAFAGGVYTISSGISLSITAGGAGSGGPMSTSLNPGSGLAGKTSTVVGLVTAVGGNGGTGNNSGGTVSGGAGGLASASIGQIVKNGVSGASGTTGVIGLGAVGGAGGNSVDGSGALAAAGGAERGSFLGATAGNPGFIPGGGGGGAKNLLATPTPGGVGGAGKVILTYDCPVYSLTGISASVVDLCAGTSSSIVLSGLAPGVYSVGYEVNTVAQTPASMIVNATGSGSFIAPGFTTLGNKILEVKSLTSGTSANAADNCTTSNISSFNTITVTTISSGTAPFALAGTGATCNQITANWQAVSGATYYELDVATDAAFTNFVAGYTAFNVGNVLTKNIAGLVNTSNYFYRVRAYKGTCISANSNVITYKPAIAPGNVVLLPVTSVNCSVFTANWTAETNAATYLLDVSTDSNFGTFIYNSLNVGNVTNYTVTGLSASTTYYYRIRAQNGCNSSPVGTAVVQNTMTTSAIPGAIVANSPTNIICSVFTANWDAQANAASYLLDVSTDINFGSFVGVYNSFNVGNVTTYTVTGLSTSTIYYYRLKGKNGCGNSTIYSNLQTAKTLNSAPVAPTAVSSSAVLCNQFTMSWGAATNALTYQVQISTNNTFPVTAATQTFSGITATSYTFTGLTVGTVYFYRVLARNGCGDSVYGVPSPTSITTLTLPATPTISASGALNICQTGNVILTSNAISNNVWSTGEVTQSIVVSSAGNYTVKVVNSAGCESPSSLPATVTISSLPTATAGGSKTVCSNGSAIVTGAVAANGTILWTINGGSGTLTNETTSNPTYTPTLGGAARTIVLTMTVTSDNACAPQIATASYTINIEAAPTATSSGSQTICSNESVTVNGATATNGTILWTHNGSGSLVNATTETPTYTAATADEGKIVTLTMTVTSLVVCSVPYSVTATYPINVKYLPAIPQSETLIPPTCLIPTGSVVLKGLPNRSDYQIVQSGTSNNIYTGGSGSDLTRFTIAGLAPGTYNFTIQFPGSCSSQPLQNVVITPLVTNTYTVLSGWSNGTTTVNQNIVFDDDFSSNSDLTGCTCKVNAGKKVTINSLHTLSVEKDLIIDSAPGTSLTFKNNSSLLQGNNNSTVNSGNIFYERTTTPIFQKDYVYWSTPVNPQKVGDVSPFSSKFYGNDGVQWVTATKPTLMKVGHGYIIRGPDNYNNDIRQDYPAVFMGVPNNGDLESEELIAKRSYLIGNPYPSALSAEALINENKMLDGTLYFWTHNTPQDLTTYTQYSPDDYAVFNLSGSVSASAKSDPLHNDDPSKDKGKKPSGKIAAGQGFYVRVILQGKVKYNNSMRLGASDNTQFFKPGAAGAIEKNRIWLNMTNAGGAFKQLLVSYIEGATNNYESKYDGVTFNANPYLDFYSVNNNTKYVIQGRALPFVDTDIVPLGYKTTIKGDFTISIDEVDGKMSNQAIYIEDKTTGEIHDLRASNYTFKTEIGTFLDRLVLRYTGKTLGTGDFENLENGISVSVKNKVINVLSSKENIKEVAVFDISGKLLYNKKKVGNTELQIPNLQSGDQVLLIKVTLENDFTTTKKVIFN
ncbi:fibronectin type III domain-containing protein [Flavobacterium sp. FlaQc-57]|uniref:fibronectin type III domain-containing protein n=1 Tax=Flavobacterium sp. FlaQc-57 TaxID=3374186 RepID=UPI0037583D2B